MSSALPSSSAKNGLPPDTRCSSTSAGRRNCLPSCARRRRSSDLMSSGPMTSRVRRSASRAVSSATRDSSLASARRARRKPIGSSRNRLAANARASADGGSSHCASSIARTSGVSSASTRIAPRTPSATARRCNPPGFAPARSSATSRASRCGSGSRPSAASGTSPRRSPSTANGSAISASTGLLVSTCSPRSPASAMPSLQSVVFPIPASPSMSSATGPRGNRPQEVVNRIDLRLAPHDLRRRRHQPSSGSLIRSYSEDVGIPESDLPRPPPNRRVAE